MFFRLPFHTSIQRFWSVLRNIPPHCEGVEKHLYTIYNIAPSYLRTPLARPSYALGTTFWPIWPTGNDRVPGGTRVNLRDTFAAVQ
jgi:hypothetical protein